MSLPKYYNLQKYFSAYQTGKMRQNLNFAAYKMVCLTLTRQNGMSAL